MNPFPNLEPVCCVMSDSNCCFFTWIQMSQEAGKVVWYSHLFKNFTLFCVCVIHTVKGFGVVNKAEVDVFLELSFMLLCDTKYPYVSIILWLHLKFLACCIGEGNGNPLQCSCLENPRDGGAWWAAVYGVAQSWTRLKRLSSSSSTLYVLQKSMCSLFYWV